MKNEIAVLGQLGIEESVVPVEQPELAKPIVEPPRYVVREQTEPGYTGLLPHTGELKQVGFLMIGLFCLVLFLMVKTTQKSKLSA